MQIMIKYGLLLVLWGWLSQARALDLSRAVVVTAPKLSIPEQKAALMLVEEVQKRTQIRWAIQSSWPASAQAVIALGHGPAAEGWPEQYRKELAASPNPGAAEAFQTPSPAHDRK